MNNSVGLLLNDGGRNHTILNNIFINNGFSIYASQSHGNTIQGNTILNSSIALLVIESHYNTFTENLLTGNDEGVFSFLSCKNVYYRNEISNNDMGIYFFISQQNTIEENNFIDNEQHASIVYANFVELFVSVYYKLHYSKNSKFLSLIGRNVWDANYWSDWESTLPKPIQRGIYLLGLQLFLSKIAGKILPFPIPQFDWHPAQEPYDIGG